MDLISSLISKIKNKAVELGKKVADDEGFFQQGRFTPIKAVQEKITNWAAQPQNYQKAQEWISLGETLNKAPSTYFQKRYKEPVFNLPEATKKLFSPKSSLLERGQGALGVLSGLGTLLPDPVGDIAFPLYDTWKGYQKAKLEGKSTPEVLKSAIQSATLEKPVGLGEAITTNEPLKQTFNIAELPLTFLVAGKLNKKSLTEAGGALETLVKQSKTKEEFIEKVSSLASNPKYQKFAKNVGKIDLSSYFDTVKPKFAKVKTRVKTTPLSQEIPVGESGGVGGFKPIESPKLKTRGVITTAKESEFVDPVIKSIIRGEYKPKTNKEVYDWAGKLVANNFDEAKKFIEKMPIQAETTAVASHMVKKYQDMGDFKSASDLIEKLSVKATKSGQFTQAFSQWKLLTPEGMQKFAQEKIKEANEKMGIMTKAVRKILGKQTKVELTNDDLREINNYMKMSLKETDEELSAKYVKKAFEVINKKLPWGVSDILDEYRYNNMLSNPLTHLRNFTSNTWEAYVVRPLTLLAQKDVKGAVKYEIGALRAIPQAIENFAKTIKEGKQFRKMDVDELVSFGLEKPKVLGRYNLPSQLMEASDQLFSTIIQAGERARGASKEEAIKTAGYYLFREGLDPKNQGWILNGLDKLTQAAYQLRKVGLGWVIPFVRTPMNVAKRWVEYSPLGFVNMIGGPRNKEQLAKALIGSAVTMYGIKLALEDRVVGPAPTDPKAKRLFYDSGKVPFSIKIGNVYVPTIAFGSLGFALTLPAIAKHYFEENPQAQADDIWEKSIKTVLGTAEYFSNQTFVKNLGDFVRLVSGDADYTWVRNLTQMANQLKPMEGLLRYISQVVDPVYRKPKTMVENLISDIPFLTKNLPYYETSTGEPATRNITSYISPYRLGFENKEFEDLYKLRIKKLQENALINKEKRELKERQKESIGEQKQIGQKILLPVDDDVKVLDLSEITIKEDDSNYQKALKMKKAFNYVDEVLDSDLPVEEQAGILSKLGISPEDAEYYNVARQPTDVKYVYVKDEIGKYGDNRQEMLNALIKMRQKINGKYILTSEIINDLVDEGILSYDEGKYLKNLKYDKKEGVKVKLTGRGRSAKIKVPKIKVSSFRFKTKAPKVKAIEVGGIRKVKGQSGRGRILKVRKVSYK